MMKKYIEENKKKVMIIAGVILVLIIALIIGLVSCGNEKSKALESKKDVAAVEEKADKDAEEEDKDKDKKDEKKDEKDSKKDDSAKTDDKKQDKDSSKSKSTSAKSPAASSGSQVSKPAASSGGSSSSASSSSGSTVKKPSSGSSGSSGGSTTTDKPKEKVWVVDKQAWTEQVPEYGYGYQIYVNGSLVFETANPAAYEAKMDYYANQGIPTTQKMGQIVVGYKTINHPEEGHWEYR